MLKVYRNQSNNIFFFQIGDLYNLDERDIKQNLFHCLVWKVKRYLILLLKIIFFMFFVIASIWQNRSLYNKLSVLYHKQSIKPLDIK